jgi:pimeloyl-ACP methyl ester carboxylesterase
VAVLQGLIGEVRAGKYTGSIGVPEKVALIGFSFGSYITHNVLSATPDLADAAVLTAIGLNVEKGVNGNGLLRSFMPRIASGLNSKRFGELDAGYLSWRDVWAMSLK